MNNYIIIELQELKRQLNGYNMLFNYRMTNMCVKAAPTAMLPVTVTVAGTDYNIEEVADGTRPDDFTFNIYPKNPNNLQNIIDGVFDVHPEFKMEIKTREPQEGEDDQNGEKKKYIQYTMPEVDKNRRDFLKQTVETFHKECKADFDTTYAKLQARLAEPYTRMTPPEVDEANKAFKEILDDFKGEADKMLDEKLEEIEEGYLRYLSKDDGKNHPSKPKEKNVESNDGSRDVTKSFRFVID